MSIKVATRVWETSQHTGTALLAMLALADHANDDGYCWPGMASIAHKVRVKERQCVNVIHALEQSGEVFVDRGVGRNGTSKYLIILGLEVAEIAKSLITYFQCPKAKAIPTAMALFEKVQAIAPLPANTKKVQFLTEKVQPTALKGAIAYRKGAIAIAPEPSLTINEPSTNHQDSATAETGPTNAPTSEGEGQEGNATPLQQSPHHDDVPPTPGPVAKPARPADPVFDKLCSMTQSVAAMHGGMVGATRKKINLDQTHPCTLANLEIFELWWCSTYYSKGGTIPTLGQVSQRWGQAMTWGEKNAPKPAPLAETLGPDEAAALEAKLMDEIQAKADEIAAKRAAKELARAGVKA